MKLTRRQLAAVVSAAATLPQTKAQTEQRAATPADDLQTARDRMKAASEALAQHDLPMSTEPAFRFKA
jgi:hypothetical protein